QAARALEAERKARAAAEAADAARLKVKMASSNQGITQIQAERKKQLKGQESASVKQAPAPPATVSEEAPSAAEAVSPEEAVTTIPAPAKSAQDPNMGQESPAADATPTDDLFNQAQKKYEAGSYQNAYEMFESYIDKNGSSANAIQARYMMGECLYQQKEYDQAILQYQKIIASQPKHAKTPAALLKQGMAFEQLSDKDTAKIIYQKIISSYGSSPEAQQAKSKLSSL
ncbi:MAG: tol-pal system protein YbgF, partial [Proteobacteria bacterium]|nr:tol-pal system protein YbgF [Pseudomonadota bacterium]